MTQETKEMIEKEAQEYQDGHDYKSSLDASYFGYLDAALKYVEKVEEEKKLTDNWIQIAKEKNKENTILSDQLESKDQELSRLKVIASQLAIALEYPNLTTQSKTGEALTAYAEFQKEK